MSKFLKIMIVLLTIAAVATPVLAEDRLTLGGQMRVRGAYLDNYISDGEQQDGSMFDFDQRLRVGGKLSIADGVSITFRTDFSEGDWGNDNGYGRFDTIKDMDRAHIDLDGDMYHLRIGTQNWFWGKTLDIQETGATFTIKSAMPIDIMYALIDDNQPDADAHLYAARVGHSMDNYSASLIVGGYNGGATDEASYNLFAGTLDYNLDAIKIMAELDFFTGDYTEDVDAVGTQGYVDVSLAASEAMTVGGAFYYAMGADDDEYQLTYLGNNFNVWDPLNHGPMQNYNLQAIKRPYDFFGFAESDGYAGAGVMALQGYVGFQANDDLALTGSLAYAEPEDDDNTGVDSALIINVGADYQLMANTDIVAQAQYIDPDAPGADALTSVGTALRVNF